MSVLGVLAAALAVIMLPLSEGVAQDDGVTVVEEGAAIAAESEGDLTLEEEEELEVLKRELAIKLHEIRPAAIQVESAVNQVAETLPYEERQMFLERVMSYIDFERLEQVSVDAAVEVFTLEELEVMIDYFRKPEARSISEKMPIYQGLVRPEITNMLDKALLELRTGKLKSPNR